MTSHDAKIFVAQPPRRHWLRAAIGAVLLLLIAAVLFFVLRDRVSAHETLPAAASTTPVVHTTGVIPQRPLIPSAPAAEAVDERRAILNGLRGHLLLHLPFSSSLKDHSPHAHDLASSGAIEVHDGAAHFPGDAYLTLPHIPLDNRPFAFSVWIRPEGEIVGYGLLEQSGGGPGKLLHILMRDPDRPYLGFFMNDLRAPSSIRSERWTHLAFQFTGSHQQIWIDGQLAVERVADPFYGDTGETRIGKAPTWNNVPTQCFKGAMRDLRLYDVALTAQQIRLLAGLNGNALQKTEQPDDQF